VHLRSIYTEVHQGLEYLSNTHGTKLTIRDEPDTGRRKYRELSSRMFPVGWSLPEDYASLDEFFVRNLNYMNLEESMEEVDGIACCVIQGMTPYGFYRVWIDPDHDFQMRRAEICKRTGDRRREIEI
jgi:hypothetical protein